MCENSYATLVTYSTLFALYFPPNNACLHRREAKGLSSGYLAGSSLSVEGSDMSSFLSRLNAGDLLPATPMNEDVVIITTARKPADTEPARAAAAPAAAGDESDKSSYVSFSLRCECFFFFSF